MLRDRLFALLDGVRAERRAIHISGPPGAGKTTLVASWLDARAAKGIWYQVDSDDAELPTFFHYLGQAAEPYARRRQRPLPALTPEYQHDVTGFARRFFRELFARLPAGSALVLDNYHEVGSEQLLHRVIADASDELPEGTRMITISRSDLPSTYARAIANEYVAIVGWAELRLDLEEAQFIGAQRGVEDTALIERLHKRADGWAAGFTLLLERGREELNDRATDSPDSLREVFDYFAGQLFDRAPAESRRLLLELSYLPRIPASAAQELTGSDRAVLVLDDLHHRNLFTDRRFTREPVYQFHALFRSFLTHRARRAFSTEEQLALLRKGAQVLDRSGEPEAAMELLLRANDHEAARTIVLRESERLIDQGRWQIVLDWIAALPVQTVRGDCRLLWWNGVARAAIAPIDARRSLEESYALARRAADTVGQLEAAAAIVQTYITEYSAFWPLDRWIDAMHEATLRRPRFDSEASELRVQSALLIALSYRRPSSPDLAACVQRLFDLVQGDGPPNLRLSGLAYLLAYATTTGILALAERAMPLLEALLDHPDARPLNVAWSSFIIAHYNIVRGHPSEVRRSAQRIERIAEEHRLPFVRSLSNIIQAWHECQLGELAAARHFLGRLENSLDRSRAYDVASMHTLRMLIAYLDNDGQRAVQEGATAAALFDATGSVMHRMLCRDLLAGAALHMGKVEEAHEVLAALRAVAPDTRPDWMEGRIRVHEALAMLDAGNRDGGLQALREGLALTREHGVGAQLGFARPLMPRVAATALEAGIEVNFIRTLVRNLALRAPPTATDVWPWPIKVYTLGQFHVLIDDRPLEFSRKVPRKPFALLKAIIAMGGHEVRTERLMDALWPEEPGDRAHEAFHQALSRLRKLLGHTQSARLLDGRVSLDEQLVWTDTRAFEDELEDPERARHALQVYKGDFLADELDQPWAASMRERLRAKFLHWVGREAAKLEAAQRWDEAIALHLRGIGADALTESFYQGLIRCHAAQGQRAEALSIYRRLRHQLSVTLGMTPSPSSEALVRELGLK
jgi:ATP/maltotriose-dependent transcriptional regulator MalT/DNA-binding SARP family transcriptional activator